MAPQEAVHVEPTQGELEVNAFRLHVFSFVLYGVFHYFSGFFPAQFVRVRRLVGCNSSSVLNLDLGGFLFSLFLSSLVS